MGKAIAKRFHEKNCIVVANYNKSASEAFALVDQLNKDSTAGNPSAIAIKCNVFVPEEVDTMIRCIIEKYSRIDVLVNNAGVRFDKLTPRMTVEEFTSTLHNNVVSAFYCSQQCIVKGGMLKHRWGRIINMSSVVGMV